MNLDTRPVGGIPGDVEILSRLKILKKNKQW